MKKLLLCGMIALYSNLFAQIENGMIAHFPFNNNLDDLSSSNVVLSGSGISFGPNHNADTNRAVVFNGSGSISFDDADLRVPLPISVSFWLKINSLQSVSSPILYSEDQLSNYSGYFIAITTAGNIAMHMGDGSGEGVQFRRSFITTDALTPGTWYHITCIYRTYDDMEVYIDCNHASGSYSGSGSTTIDYLNIGGSIGYEAGNMSTPDRYSDMALSQLAIWDRELTPGEIAYLCEPNTVLSIQEREVSKNKEILKYVDLLGRETEFKSNIPLIILFRDGTAKKIFRVE